MPVPRNLARSCAQRFAHDRRGNVAIIFGLALMPILASVGMAVDYGRAGSTHGRLQGAVDTAALAVSHQAEDLDEAALTVIARKIVDSNFGTTQGAEVADVKVKEGTKDVTVTATAKMPTSFAGLVGISSLSVSAQAKTVWGGNPIELALVLDNTGSMVKDKDGKKNAKLSTMQTAVRNMLKTLNDPTAIAQGAVKVAIVPFNTQVRVPTTNAGATWLRDYKTSYEDAVARGDSNAAFRWGMAMLFSGKWTGCIDARNQSYDVDDTPATSVATRYPQAPCSSGDLQDIQPLTDNFTTLNTKVDNLKADGSTSVTIGVAWGMVALSKQTPLTQAATPGTVPGLKQFMVVLTDGENSSSGDDARTKLACQSAQDMGIEVFTIRVIEGNEDLLEDCASDASHYFNVENVDDLLPAFEAITTQISELRLAQ